MHFLGGNGVSHQQVLKIIQTEGGHGLRLDSTWKESWAIMQNRNITHRILAMKLSELSKTRCDTKWDVRILM